MKNLEFKSKSVEMLSAADLQNTQGGWFDISLVAFIEEFVDYDLNGNGITGIGCLIGC